MKKLSLEEIKKEELNLLFQIDRICRENDIKYSLAFGTLIGAIRHKGFIPWDDDIDIFMFRSDYEKFLNYCENNQDDLKIKSIEKDKDYNLLFAKVYNPNIILKMNKFPYFKSSYGLYVDIFVLDGLGDNYEEICSISENILLDIQSLCSKKFLPTFSKHIPTDNILYNILYGIKVYLTNRNYFYNKIKDNFKKYSEKNSIYVANYFSLHTKRGIFEKKWFNEYVELEFENHKFLSLKDYDKLLTQVYGDYMQLPPEDKRVSNHSFEAYYKE